MLKIAFPVWSLALFIRLGSERLSTLTNSDPPWRTKLLHHWGFSKDCAMRSDALLEESVGLLSSVAGIKYEFLACLFGRGQDTFGCANSGLVKIPILKHGQQTCHTPPHPMVTNNLVSISVTSFFFLVIITSLLYFFNSTYMQYHIVFLFLCLTYFSQHNASKSIHIAANGKNLFFFWLSNIPLYIHTTSSLSIHLLMYT